jgi:anti-sigma regulatory factor (Ser/Thr protein kinase)
VRLARRAAQTFGPSTGEVMRARRLMGACLDEWEASDEDRAALVLVVCELVTNAILHGRGSVELHVYASDAVVRLEVCDQGGGQPRLRPPERSGPHVGGWGLHMVDQLVDVWGTTVRPGRTVVWVQRAITRGPVRSLRRLRPVAAS